MAADCHLPDYGADSKITHNGVRICLIHGYRMSMKQWYCGACAEVYCEDHDVFLPCDECEMLEDGMPDEPYMDDDGDPGDVMLEDREPHLYAI